MWLSRTVFEKLITDAAEARGQSHALTLQVNSQKSTMDWMAMRLTQSEHERAQLIHNYTGVKIAVPSIEPQERPVSAADLMSQTISFEDVGDVEAERQGIGWDESGEVVHGVKKQQ